MGGCVWWNKGGEGEGRCRFGGLGEESDSLCRLGCSSSSETFEYAFHRTSISISLSPSLSLSK